MSCPLFKDYTRECISQIEIYPKKITKEIMEFCTTDRYIDCPFYKMLNMKKYVCKNISKCHAFEKFQIGGFKELAEISNKYCTSKNHVNCERYILKENGKVSPDDLHPDGSSVPEWKT